MIGFRRPSENITQIAEYEVTSMAMAIVAIYKSLKKWVENYGGWYPANN